MKRRLIFIIILCLAFPQLASAGVYNDTKSYLIRVLSNISGWWETKSVGPAGEGDEPEESGPAEVAAPGMCQVAQQPPVIVCEKGSGFLCVNTPEPGVAGTSIIIKGTIDKAGSMPASISVSVQHEYTKKTQFVDTSNPESSDCWDSELSSKPFCLDDDGFYAARVPLGELGPYTVAVGATRIAGDSVTSTVRTSQVKSFSMADGNVKFEPDIRATNIVDKPYVDVTVSVIGDCQHCDFIGASTFGVTVTVENVMRDSNGNTSSISCATNVEQGGQGVFVVGIPVGNGANELKITACNAATQDACPTVSGVKFEGRGGIEGLSIINPPPSPSYSSSDYPTVPFQFKIPGAPADTCVDVSFNRDSKQEICSSSDGIYDIDLNPQAGLNVLTIDNDELGIHFPWVFGWGEIASPFAQGGGVEDGLAAKNAFELVLPKETITDIIGPMISNILKSDELAELAKKISSEGDASSTDEQQDETSVEIPKCSSGGGSLGDFKLTLVGDPSIGNAKIEGITFEKDKMRASINADNASVTIGLVKGEQTVPLKLSFRKVVIDLLLRVDKQNGLVLLDSPHTDCDYKSARFCKGTPAALIPQNIVGDATPFGHFVRCDADEDICEAFNSLNAQTGLISDTVLDAINNMLYCSGSKALTGLVKEGIRDKIEIKLGDIAGPFDLPAGLNLGGGITIDEKGLLIGAGIVAGDAELFSNMPDALKIPSVGAIGSSKGPLITSVDSAGAKLRLAVAADAINRLLFAVNSFADSNGRGVLDIDISEPFFAKAGFDFVSECDAFIESGGQDASSYSPLCNMRPRVSELLGTPLTRYGYFPAKHPLLLRIKSNRALPPHISVVNITEIPIVVYDTQTGGTSNEEIGSNLLDVQIGGLVMSFYALEVDDSGEIDKYGNLPVKLDSQGNPVIRSMRPGDPDPSHGQIASFELALLLAVEIGDVKASPEDPSKFEIMVRPLANRSRLVISPVAGSNSTTIPPVALISVLREKLQYAINIYSSREEAIRIPVAKEFSFDEELLGTIDFGSNGLSLSFDDDYDYISAGISASITQILHQGGVEFQDTLPH